jgi:hypothetical protein
MDTGFEAHCIQRITTKETSTTLEPAPDKALSTITTSQRITTHHEKRKMQNAETQAQSRAQADSIAEHNA